MHMSIISRSQSYKIMLLLLSTLHKPNKYSNLTLSVFTQSVKLCITNSHMLHKLYRVFQKNGYPVLFLG